MSRKQNISGSATRMVPYSSFDAMYSRIRQIAEGVYHTFKGGSFFECDDLVDVASVKVWKNLGSYNPAMSFDGWAYTIVKNTWLDMLKQENSRRERFSPLVLMNEDGDEYENPGTRVEGEAEYDDFASAEGVDLIMEHVKSLPNDKYRKALTMSIEGYSIEEIAAELGCSKANVSTWLTRGRDIIRKSLANTYPALKKGK